MIILRGLLTKDLEQNGVYITSKTGARNGEKRIWELVMREGVDTHSSQENLEKKIDGLVTLKRDKAWRLIKRRKRPDNARRQAD